MASSSIAVDIICLSLVINGLSTTLTSLNYITTVLIYRNTTLNTLLVYLWSIIITTLLLLLVLPILAVCLLLLVSDIHYNTNYYDPLCGGDPIFYQHIFWFFGHPEVYILLLPALGMISLVLHAALSVYIYGNE